MRIFFLSQINRLNPEGPHFTLPAIRVSLRSLNHFTSIEFFSQPKILTSNSFTSALHLFITTKKYLLSIKPFQHPNRICSNRKPFTPSSLFSLSWTLATLLDITEAAISRAPFLRLLHAFLHLPPRPPSSPPPHSFHLLSLATSAHPTPGRTKSPALVAQPLASVQENTVQRTGNLKLIRNKGRRSLGVI